MALPTPIQLIRCFWITSVNYDGTADGVRYELTPGIYIIYLKGLSWTRLFAPALFANVVRARSRSHTSGGFESRTNAQSAEYSEMMYVAF